MGRVGVFTTCRLTAGAAARKVQRRAAAVGFDWPTTGPLAKIREEVGELEQVPSQAPAAGPAGRRCLPRDRRCASPS
jgi:hypothetical protein